jgi:hypothetical protein
MPSKDQVVEMFRADLAKGRELWLNDVAPGSEAYQQRAESDFLKAKSSEGQVLDFHSLRHTCGAWLASEGVNPKTIQSIMRHSQITLTMDTYGHLLPGQEAQAVQHFPAMLPGATSEEAGGWAQRPSTSTHHTGHHTVTAIGPVASPHASSAEGQAGSVKKKRESDKSLSEGDLGTSCRDLSGGQ